MWIREIKAITPAGIFNNDEIDIEFEFSFDNTNEPDSGEITLYNLSNDTLAKMKTNSVAGIVAGYKNWSSVGTIFNGNVDHIYSRWEGVDRATTLIVTDSGSVWRESEYKEVYEAGTSAREVIMDVLNNGGIDYDVIELVDNVEFPRGYSVSGKVSKTLQKLARITKTKMQLVDGQIVMRPFPKGKQLGIVLSADSGLIGTPAVENTGFKKPDDKSSVPENRWRLQSLVIPGLEADGIVQVESKTINGRYRVVEGKYNKNFTMDLVVVEAEGG